MKLTKRNLTVIAILIGIFILSFIIGAYTTRKPGTSIITTPPAEIPARNDNQDASETAIPTSTDIDAILPR